MDKWERRRLRLIEVRDLLCEGSNAELARCIKKTDSYVSRMLYPADKAGRKRIGEDTLDAIDEAFSWAKGSFDSQLPVAELALHGMHKTKLGGGKNNAPKGSVIDSQASGSASTLHNQTEKVAPAAQGKLPVISWEQAANWENLVDRLAKADAKEWLLSGHDSPPPRAYYLHVSGLGMYNPSGFPSFRENDLIEVWPQDDASGGDLVIARTPSGDVFRQLIVDSGKRYLQALNPSWPDRIVPMTDDVRIRGVVKSQITRFG